MSLPPGFTAIKDARHKAKGDTVSFIGVIVAVTEPRKSRGTDWVWEITIQDEFVSDDTSIYSTISCRFFKPDPDFFPKVSGYGDIALLREFKMDFYNGKPGCMTKPHVSKAAVFPSASIPRPEMSQAYQQGTQTLPFSAMRGLIQPTSAEQCAAILLKGAASCEIQKVKQRQGPSFSVTHSKKDRLSLIKDMDINKFYDVRAQVVNVYRNNRGEVEIKVTDYTSNDALYLYPEPDDPMNWNPDKSFKGPYGQLTLQVILYGNNSIFGMENLQVGDYVFLRNMHTKLSPVGKLEGVLHEDRQHPDQVDIRKLVSESDIDEIKQRKEEYERLRAKPNAFEELGNVPKKASAKASAGKKSEKRARQKLQKEEEQKAIAEEAERWEAQKTGVNLNIRAAFPEIQPSTISDIIYNSHLKGYTPTKYNEFTLPFVNCKHRSRVRIIDFFPPELELFAHHTADPAWDKRAKQDDHQRGRWEWGFVLLLEDAKLPGNTVSEKLRVIVTNDAAQYLLDMDARDLKNDRRTLKRLEEKLFILWGNLYELKTELRDRGSDLPLPPGDNRLQNKPFDCCIEEFGHEVNVTTKNPAGYQRMHRLAGTKIQLEM